VRRREAEAEITATAEENGILTYAGSNAEDSIRAFVTTLGFDEVEFVSSGRVAAAVAGALVLNQCFGVLRTGLLGGARY
jgi:hypothetical protein